MTRTCTVSAAWNAEYICRHGWQQWQQLTSIGGESFVHHALPTVPSTMTGDDSISVTLGHNICATLQPGVSLASQTPYPMLCISEETTPCSCPFWHPAPRQLAKSIRPTVGNEKTEKCCYSLISLSLSRGSLFLSALTSTPMKLRPNL